MMLYLSSNSRPDIAFAVHQCARCSHCTKLVHEQAVKIIARYLKGSRGKGVIFQPTDDLTIEFLPMQIVRDCGTQKNHRILLV